jgi:hypothetical protein
MTAFLAHLAKGNVSFCHHLASVIRRPLTFHNSLGKSYLPFNRGEAAMFANRSG